MKNKGRKLVAALLILITVFFGMVYGLSSIRMNKKFALAKESVIVSMGADSIAEGKRLFISRGCDHCHGENLAGRNFLSRTAIGNYFGSNLTSGRGGLRKELSDNDLARAIRQGVAPDGHALIFMPAIEYHSMSDEDVAKIISYIRSAKPVDRKTPTQTVGPLARMLFLFGKMPVLVAADQIDPAARPPVRVRAAATIEYGRYLAAMCTGCHGPELSGGPIPGGAPGWPPAQNLTPAGIGGWTKADFIKAIRSGIRPDGTVLRAPMPWQNLSHMSNVELQALWLYLHSLPARAIVPG